MNNLILVGSGVVGAGVAAYHFLNKGDLESQLKGFDADLSQLPKADKVAGVGVALVDRTTMYGMGAFSTQYKAPSLPRMVGYGKDGSFSKQIADRYVVDGGFSQGLPVGPVVLQNGVLIQKFENPEGFPFAIACRENWGLAFRIEGAHYEAWRKQGFASGPLGCPNSDYSDLDDEVSTQAFEGGITTQYESASWACWDNDGKLITWDHKYMALETSVLENPLPDDYQYEVDPAEGARVLIEDSLHASTVKPKLFMYDNGEVRELIVQQQDLNSLVALNGLGSLNALNGNKKRAAKKKKKGRKGHVGSIKGVTNRMIRLLKKRKKSKTAKYLSKGGCAVGGAAAGALAFAGLSAVKVTKDTASQGAGAATTPLDAKLIALGTSAASSAGCKVGSSAIKVVSKGLKKVVKGLANIITSTFDGIGDSAGFERTYGISPSEMDDIGIDLAFMEANQPINDNFNYVRPTFGWKK